MPHHCLTPKNNMGNIFIWSHSLLGNAHIYLIPRDQRVWLTMTKWNGARGLFSSPSVTSQRADSAGHLVQLKNWLTPDTGFQILPPFSKATCSNTGVYCYMTMQMSSDLLPCKSVNLICRADESLTWTASQVHASYFCQAWANEFSMVVILFIIFLLINSIYICTSDITGMRLREIHLHNSGW